MAITANSEATGQLYPLGTQLAKPCYILALLL